MHQRILRTIPLILIMLAALGIPLSARGTNEEGWVPVEGQENWRRELDISEQKPGTYNVIIRGRDYAGNEFVEGPYNLQIDPDSDLPVSRIIYPEEESVVRDDVNIIGIAVDDDAVGRVEVALNDGEFQTAQGTDYWRFAIPAEELENGVHTIRVRSTDIYGVPGNEITGTFTLDTQNPEVRVSSHENGAQVTGRVRFEGIAVDANGLSEIWLEIPRVSDGQSPDTLPASLEDDSQEFDMERLRFRRDRETGEYSFSFDVDTRRLEDGPHVYWIRGVDTTGAEGRYPFLFFVDNKAPDITILNPGQDEATFGTLFINGVIRDTMGIQRFWYEWQDQEIEIPLTSGNPFWNITLDTRELTSKTTSVPFYALDTSGNQSRAEIRVTNDREGARPVVRLFEIPVMPSPDPSRSTGSAATRDLGRAVQPEPSQQGTFRFAGEESLRVSRDTSISGRLDGVHPGSTVRVEGLWEESRSLPAGPVFTIDLSDVPPGDKTVTLTGTDEFGYQSLPRRLKLTVLPPAPKVSIETLTYQDAQDQQPASYRPGLSYDPRRKASLTALVHAETRLREGLLILQPGQAALQRGADPGDFARQPVEVKARITEIPPEQRGPQGQQYKVEAELPQGLGYGSVAFQLLVQDEFSLAGAAQGLLTIQDLRRNESEPRIVISDERFSGTTMSFSTQRPLTGTVFGMDGLPQGPDQASVSLVLPGQEGQDDATGADTENPGADESSIIRLTQGARNLPVGSRSNQQALFQITPQAEGTLSGVRIRAELRDGVIIESPPFSVEVDLTNPRLELSLPSGQFISGNSLAIAGEARDSFRIERVRYSLDDGKTFTDIPASPRGSGLWSFRTSVDLGERPKEYYGLIVEAMDSAGRTTRLVRGITTLTPEPLPVLAEGETRRNDQAVIQVLAQASAVFDGQAAEDQPVQQSNLRYALAGIVKDLDGISRLEGAMGDGEFQTLVRFDQRNHYQDFIMYPDQLTFGRLEPGSQTLRLRAVDRQNEPGRETRITLRVPYPQPAFSGAPVLSIPQFPVLSLGSTAEVGSFLQGLPASEIASAEYSLNGAEYTGLSKGSTDESGGIPLTARISSRDLPYGLHDLTIQVVTKDGWVSRRSTTLLVLDTGDSSPAFGPDSWEPRVLAPQAGPLVSYTGLSRPEDRVPAVPGLNLEWQPITGASRLTITDPQGFSAFVPGRPLASAELARESAIFRVGSRNNTLDFRPLAEGTEEGHELIITTRDGVTRTIGPFSVTVDFASPSLTLDNPGPTSIHNKPIPLVLTSGDAHTLQAVEYRFLELEPLIQPKEKPQEAESPGAWRSLPGIAVDQAMADFPESSHNSQLAVNTLEPGGRILLIRSRDEHGRESVRNLPVFIDLTAPQFSLLTPPATTAVNGRTTVSGRILTDAKQSRITKVEYSLDGETYTSLPPGPTVDVEVDFSQLTQNDQTLHIRVTDQAGNSAVYTPKPRVDLEADFPSVQIQIPQAHAVITEDLQISGMVFDDDGVDQIFWRLDDGEFRPLATKNNFSIEIPLSTLTDNEHLLQVYAVDRFGLEGETVDLPFSVSLQEPGISLDSPGVDDISRGVVDLVGRTWDQNGVQELQVSMDNGTSFYRTTLSPYDFLSDSHAPPSEQSGEEPAVDPQSADSPDEEPAQATQPASIDQDWLYQLDTRIFVDGTYSLQVSATDRFGITAQYFTLVTLDNTPPVLQIDQPAEGARLAGAIPLSGRVTDNIEIQSLTALLEPINGQAEPRIIELPTQPILQHEIPLGDVPPGWYNLRLTALDGAGNESLVDLNLQVADQVTSSRVDILYPLEGEVQHGPVIVEGRVTGNVPVNRAQLYVNDRFTDTLEVDPRGYFTYKMESGTVANGPVSLRAVVEPTPEERISSPERRLFYQEQGPYITIDSHQSGDVLSNRPFISGTAGYIHGLDPENRENRQAIDQTRLSRLSISLDNGKTFTSLPARDEWKYRVETGELTNGPLAVILRAEYRNGEAAVIRSLYTIDKEAPEIALLSPLEGARINDSVVFQGTAYDDFGIDDLQINLRPGDKAGYSVPEFIQGMYIDADFMGLTYWKIGLGLTFFDDNVKLQAHFGVGPEQVGGEPARMSGYFIGGKLLANIASIPFSAIFGPDWTWLSMNIAVGADFSYISLYNPIEFDTGVDVKTIDGVVLSAIVAQIEFPRINIEDLAAFNTYSFYTEPEVWFVPSDVDPKIVPKITFGVRVGLF